MVRSLTWWGVQFTINFLSLVTTYVIAHAVLKRRIAPNWKHAGMAMLYTIVVAPLFYFDNYTGQIAGILGLLLVVQLITKRKMEDSILIFGLSMVVIATLQLPSISVALLFYSWLDFYESFMFLIGSLLTFGGVILVSKNFKLQQWFHALQINAVLKLILSIMFLILLIIAFILNFEYQLSYLLFFILMMVMIGIILFPVLVKLYYRTTSVLNILLNVHDLKNSLLSTGIAIRHTNDINQVYRMYDKLSKQFGMDLSQLSHSKLEDDLDQMEWIEKQVEFFIKTKKGAHKRDAKVITNIRYLQMYNVVDLQLVLKWLGTLLDNALEA